MDTKKGYNFFEDFNIVLKDTYDTFSHENKDKWSVEFINYHNYLMREIHSLTAVLLLAKEYYIPAFRILRSSFESYLLYKLYVNGTKVRATKEIPIRIEPSDHKNPQARDLTLSRWKEEHNQWIKTKNKELQNYEEVIEFCAVDDDKIKIKTRVRELYDSKDPQKNGIPIFPYSFKLHEYDPSKHWVLKLTTIKENSYFTDIIKKLQEDNEKIYRDYFRIERIIESLKHSNLIDNEAEDRVKIHYAFLSFFVHPTRLQQTLITPDSKDPILEELILHYCLKLQALMADEFLKKITSFDKKIDYNSLQNKIDESHKLTRELWFIYNEPTEFDKKYTTSYSASFPTTKTIMDSDYLGNPLNRWRKIIENREHR